MPKTFVHKGDTYMVVQPYPHLLRSRTIREGHEAGRLFGVNLDQGRFGFIPKEVMDRHNLKLADLTIRMEVPRFGQVVVEMFEDNTCRAYIYGQWVYADSPIELSKKIVGMHQIRSQANQIKSQWGE